MNLYLDNFGSAGFEVADLTDLKVGDVLLMQVASSYVFNGAVNTTAQGHPVPVGYGRMIVGSAVISAGIDVDEIPVDESPV